MINKPIREASFVSPLCFMPNGGLLCYQNGQIKLFCGTKCKDIVTIESSNKEHLLGWSKYATRFSRLGVRAAVALDNEHVVLSKSNCVFELDLTSGKQSKGWVCGDGIRPLTFTEVKGIKDFASGLYFGGYLGNMEKKPVNIYHRICTDQWRVVYTFPQGVINHVHNIVPDPYRQCLWVFTGDFGEAAAIWKVTDHFSRVERVACNDQKYRACVAYALPEGLLYATDAPFADNKIYLMNPDIRDIKEIFPIHGSCIYGCKWKNNYVFSSTVEGDGRHTSILDFLFGRKRGSGIKDDYVHMYIGNLIEGFKEVYKEKKDCMPYYTFQFGAFKFPSGENNTEKVYFQPVATQKHDLDLMAIIP